MNNIRESSQQDRRVYVGNLSYDVKWHHLKDFMRQGGFLERLLGAAQQHGRLTTVRLSWRGSLRRCAASS
jgi:RNA recognition motif-containing protein